MLPRGGNTEWSSSTNDIVLFSDTLRPSGVEWQVESSIGW